MPEGRDRLQLFRPGASSPNEIGELAPGSLTPIIAFAIRVDRAGSEKLFSDIRSGEWAVRFEIRKDSAWSDIDPSWSIIDSKKVSHQVDSVIDKPGAQRRFIWIYTTARR